MSVNLRRGIALICMFAALNLQGKVAAAQGPSKVLWNIGSHNKSDSEFALAPGGYQHFGSDGVYLVGRSRSYNTWPYVQPGPQDAWAGSRNHTFRIFFALAKVPVRSVFRLNINLLDTQDAVPPKIRVSIGHFAFYKQLQPGSGDATVFGTSQNGRPSDVAVPIPTSALRAGSNELSITTVAGSWMLYDSVSMHSSNDVMLSQLPALHIVSVQSSPWILRQGASVHGTQSLSVTLWNYTRAQRGVLEILGKTVPTTVAEGLTTAEVQVPLVHQPIRSYFKLVVGHKVAISNPFQILPVRHWKVYLIPHSHVDIGYTDLQANVRKKHISNLLTALDLIRSSGHNPVGSRFKWNLEVIWPFNTYLPTAPAAVRNQVETDLRAGSLGLDGFYGNLLTGLCTSDELLHAFDDGLVIASREGVPLTAGMQDDVPGNTWGNVSALAQAGIKYLSLGPNPGDRMGQSLIRWQDKPFYWQSESGRHRVLVWMVHGGYSLGVGLGGNLTGFLPGYLSGLQRDGYPYDITCLHWLSTGDNGAPDPELAATVAAWNRKYVSPQLIISRTAAPFKALISRYGNKIPTLRGDFTPYWEDGAGTSARETALNRNAAARIEQAEALWAMCNRAPFASTAFHAAWDNTLLYSEHTWGAWDSTSNPDLPFVKSQWKVKRAYAYNADKESRALVRLATGQVNAGVKRSADNVMVYNTESWKRSEVVFLTAKASYAGDRVQTANGTLVPSQRLADGRLAILAQNVPAFGSRKYTITAGTALSRGDASASVDSLSNGVLRVRIDGATGAIAWMKLAGLDTNLVESKKDCQVNSYFYLLGGDLKNLVTNGTPSISVTDAGPLVASIRVISTAPGCNSLTRTVTVCSGQADVLISDNVDKKKVLAYEGVHIGFGFNVPNAVTRMDMPLSVVRPGIDQLPASCMNWFPVQDWVDVSNGHFGVTWATRDAPLVEVGAITAVMPGEVSPTDPRWLTHITSSSRIYSWVMNNHWHTNYRAYQYGPVDFRYAIRPHLGCSLSQMARFGMGFSHPLLAMNCGSMDPVPSLLTLSTNQVVVREIEPLSHQRGYLVRLWGASGKTTRVTLTWRGTKVRSAYLSNTKGTKIRKVGPVVSVPGFGLVTLRIK